MSLWQATSAKLMDSERKYCLGCFSMEEKIGGKKLVGGKMLGVESNKLSFKIFIGFFFFPQVFLVWQSAV